MGALVHKILLFADNVFFVSKKISLPALMRCLTNYGQVSGYKINEGKSEAMMITGSWPKQLDRREI